MVAEEVAGGNDVVFLQFRAEKLDKKVSKFPCQYLKLLCPHEMKHFKLPKFSMMMMMMMMMMIIIIIIIINL